MLKQPPSTYVFFGIATLLVLVISLTSLTRTPADVDAENTIISTPQVPVLGGILSALDKHGEELD